MKTVFQPLVDLRNESLLGFEALTRFEDGRGPREHFRQAKEEGNLVALEHEAIARILESTQPIPDGYLVTLNASGESIHEFDAHGHHLDSRLQWGLELTENPMPGCLAEVRKIADELGILLLVDDAGAACANRDRILGSRPDIVKFDRSIIWNFAACQKTRDNTYGLLQAARHAGARTLVEGIETPAHLELAIELGFDYAQGFYYCRGLSGAALGAAMEELHRRVGIGVPGF